MKVVRSLFLTFICLTLIASLKAQEYRYEFGADLGTSYYAGDLARKGFLVPHSLTATGFARYNMNLRWAMRANLTYMGLRSSLPYAKNVFVQNNKELDFSTRLVNLSYGFEFNFFPFSNKYRYLNTSSFTPYLYAGVGMGLAWGDDDHVFVPNASIGFGAKYKFDKHWTISALWQWAYSFSDKLDALSDSSKSLDNPYAIDYGFMKGKDGFASISLALSYAFGRREDNNCAVPNVSL